MRLAFSTIGVALPQVKELLKPYGQLKSFNLVMDKATGKSKVGPWLATNCCYFPSTCCAQATAPSKIGVTLCALQTTMRLDFVCAGQSHPGVTCTR